MRSIDKYNHIWETIGESGDIDGNLRMHSEHFGEDNNNSEISTVVVCGGVAANRYLRKQLYELCHDLNVDIVYPSPKYCTDNGVMVAWAGMERLIHNDYTIPPIPQSSLDRFETLKLKQKEKMNSDGIYEEDQDELLPFYPSWSL